MVAHLLCVFSLLDALFFFGEEALRAVVTRKANPKQDKCANAHNGQDDKRDLCNPVHTASVPL